MSLKRSTGGGRSQFGSSGDAGAKVGRQELYDEIKRLAQKDQSFAPVDVALVIGAGEPQVSKILLGLAAESFLEKVDGGKYRAPGFADVALAEFIKALGRASKTDSARHRDLSDITRLKQNNDIMRNRLLTVVAERDHYLAALKKAGIDPGPAPLPPPPVNSAGPHPGEVSLPGTSESAALPSGPGAAGPSTPAEPDDQGDDATP